MSFVNFSKWRNNSGGLLSRTIKSTNAAYNFRDILRNYEKEERMGLYRVNAEEMRKLKEKQTFKSEKLSIPRKRVIPFQMLLERASSKENIYNAYS